MRRAHSTRTVRSIRKPSTLPARSKRSRFRRRDCCYRHRKRCEWFNSFGSGPSALGGLVKATIPVTPGETLAVFVGGAGIPEGNGYNGGGANGNSGTCSGSGCGGGGGGASDVRQSGDSLKSRVVVAGGGGGEACCNNAPQGGAGGGLHGAAGANGAAKDRRGFFGGQGGKGGSQNRGGRGGKGGRGYTGLAQGRKATTACWRWWARRHIL